MVKHNKLKNSGLIFELLVRQMTTDTLNGIMESKAANILKKYFQDSELLKEYQIYETITKTKNLSEAKADSLLNICTDTYKKLDRKLINENKYKIVGEIKEAYNLDDFFKFKVPNYKMYASIFLMLESSTTKDVELDKVIEYKHTILESISQPKQDKEPQAIDKFSNYDKGSKALVYKMFVKKFNDKYQNLNEDQKEILREYLSNPANSPKLKSVVNEGINNVKKNLVSVAKKIEDPARKVKLQEILKMLKVVPENRNINESDIKSLLQYQELLKEFVKIEN